MPSTAQITAKNLLETYAPRKALDMVKGFVDENTRKKDQEGVLFWRRVKDYLLEELRCKCAACITVDDPEQVHYPELER